MNRLALLCLLALSACPRSVALTFGEEGEGLDGFMCTDPAGTQLMSRLPEDRTANLVFDFISLGGVPGCRTGQLMRWCRTHDCHPIATARSCFSVKLPLPGAPRPDYRKEILAGMRASGAPAAALDAPDEFVIVRVVGTTESCDTVMRPLDEGGLPPFDEARLLGCAYSCPVLLDKIDQDVYLGFETLTSTCESGVKTCSALDLSWQP